ncbi:hypothetical protein Tco_1242853 [Tanacetum coccineum]
MQGGSLRLVRETLAEPSPSWSNINEENLDLGERNVKQYKRKTCDGPYTVAVRVLSSSGVAPYNEATLDDLKTKHPFKPAPSLRHTPIDHHQLIASLAIVLDMIKGFPCSASCRRDGLRVQHLMDCLSGAVVDISSELISSITQSGVEVSGGGEAILHVVNWLIKGREDDVGLLILLVDFKNAFNLMDREAWYLDDGTIIGDTLIVGDFLKVIMDIRPCQGLHLNVDKPEVFWPKEDPRSKFASVFLPNIARPLHGVKLLGGPASADFDFSSELVMKRVTKSIELIDVVAKINDPRCELLLLRACAGISKLYFAMRTCPPRVFERARRSFDAALHYALERIVTASDPGFGDWQ